MPWEVPVPDDSMAQESVKRWLLKLARSRTQVIMGGYQ